MRMLKLVLKFVLAALFVLAGVNHFLNPEFYVRMMPPYLPYHLFLVYLSGVLEIVFGVLLVTRKFARLAAFGLIALLVAIFPANLHMALNPQLYPEFSPVALWIRLPLQVIPLAWAYWYTLADMQREKHRRVAAV